MEILLALAIALFVGLMLSRLAKLAQLPAVTAYLVTGILIGPYVLGQLGVPGLGFTSMENVHSFAIISDVALGFIAFSIGNEFRMSDLRQIGKQATIIGIFQAVFTTLLVDAALIGLHFLMPQYLPLPAAIVLGAVASATAPAATLMVVRQYKAKGPVTKILLPIVALDDAVGLVLFAISFGVAKALIAGRVDVLSVIVEPILEVVLSLLLGFVMGLLFTYCERFFFSRSKRLSMSVAFVLVTVAISMMKFEIGGIHIGFSSLLSCMMLGTVFCNICDFSEGLMDRLDRWTGPMFILFFVISGAELELSVFSNWAIVVIGVLYIVFRSLGKYFGATISAKATKCDPNIIKYLGITLLPQAGVALGMALKAKTLADLVPLELLATDPEKYNILLTCGTVVSNITLFAVLVYELIGPLLTKIALQKAGEIQPEGATNARVEDKNKKTAQ
ncbi:MAG: cation:proton antiporter [Ruminococcaceae bacterium]|nr:cation:proton antiporter [Oscillospiraceae bacterium]